jgi:TRAP-type mannitol/chloroaromatic compound transport system substrate-binding protein
MRRLIPVPLAIAFALLIGLLAYLAGSHSATTPATAQAPIRWKMQTAWPLGVFPDDAAKLLVSTIEKTSGGRLKIEVSPAGAVVPPFEIQDAVSRGVLDAGHTTPGYIIGKLAAFIPLTHGPLFGMDFIDIRLVLGRRRARATQEAYQQRLKMNVVSFRSDQKGPRRWGGSRRRDPDVRRHQGQRYRIFGIGAETYSKLGIATVTLAGGEIVPLPWSGAPSTAPSGSTAPTTGILGHRQDRQVPLRPGMHEPVTVGEFIINKGKWDALPADLKEVVKTSAQASYWNHFVRIPGRRPRPVWKCSPPASRSSRRATS